MPQDTWQVEVDRSTSGEWSEMLDLFRDANIYQTWSYGRVRWGEKNLSHLVLRHNGGVAAIAQLRIIRPLGLKFGIAYLRWGPLCHLRGGELDPGITKRFASALYHEYLGKRGLLLRVLPNAFVGSQRAEMLQTAFSGFTLESGPSATGYRTFLLDLEPPLEDLRRELDKKWRNQLSRAERNGLKIVAGSGVDEYSDFCRIYREMRARKSFETTADVDEFARIQGDLPESHRMRTLLCMRGAAPVAGLVASAMGDSAIYLLGATSNEGLDSKGSYLLQWDLIKWLKEKGFKRYDLGGINPNRNPGVYHFKAGLSGVDARHVGTLTACNNTFGALAVRAGLALKRGLGAGVLRLGPTFAGKGSF